MDEKPKYFTKILQYVLVLVILSCATWFAVFNNTRPNELKLKLQKTKLKYPLTGPPPSFTFEPQTMRANSHHPQVDIKKWADIFPIETFEKREGLRRFDTTSTNDPLDLWKASGSIITSPAHLCEIELVRYRTALQHDLGEAVPVDIFLWQTGAPAKPYLTKLGGVPHREAKRPWPTSNEGTPFTFVAQFCFLDSKEIVSDKLPGDVMLVFFKDHQSHSGDYEDVRIEWSKIELDEPMTVADCPKPRFPVPELSGVIHRCNEYPDSWDVFKKEGHNQSYLFSTSQSTKIGRETHFIQRDPRPLDGKTELFCALNSIHPSAKWPFTDLETLPGETEETDDDAYGWGKYEMMFYDVGCMYFFIDDNGTVAWISDCY